MAETEQLTHDGLSLALQTLREKWGKQGAEFLNDVQYAAHRITGLFVLDGCVYEVTIHSDKSLEMFELDGDKRIKVRLPSGLAFPRGFKRQDGYDR